ncbi:hypothetical protein [Streptomyces sp. NPDC059209]|uniref:hypothetical protein n=1 Tax=Streptomyces sp. NPDC059209 TaxID=3346769 RepID=UPI00367A7C76
MSSPASTTAAREWSFVLHPQERPTEEQSDQFDHADALAGGEIGWEEDPDCTYFPCTVSSPHLEDALSWAVARLEELGVKTDRIEMRPFV